MSFQITLSTAATKSAYQRFGDAFIHSLTQQFPELDMSQCQAILGEVISTVGRKAPKEKKVPKTKAPKTPSPTKRDLKKVELIGELKSYGQHAGEIPAISDVSVTDLRKQINTAKKALKDEQKSKVSPKKTKATKSPKNASPSKRDLKKAELAAEITSKGGSLDKAVTEYSIPELRKTLKSLQPKKVKVTKASVAHEPTKRDFKKIELVNEIKALGGKVPEKPMSEFTVTELRAILKSVTPKKKKGRKVKKSAAAEADHEALLATLASSLKMAEDQTNTKVAEVAEDTTEVAEDTTEVAEVAAEVATVDVTEVAEVTTEDIDVDSSLDDELDSESDLSDSSDDEDDEGDDDLADYIEIDG